MPSQPPENNYSNIRDLLGSFIGQKLIDITQHDKDEWEETRQSYIQLIFDSGRTITFNIGDEGFHFDGDEEATE